MNLFLLRHTTPEIAPGTCYGQLDIALQNEEELKAARGRVTNLLPGAKIYSSPLRRCKQLAEFLEQPFTVDERLCELNFGDWEGRNWSEVAQEAYYTHWRADIVSKRPPDGESLADLLARVEDFWQEINQLETEEPIVLITHSGVIRCFLKMALEFPLGKLYQLPLNYGSLTELVFEKGQWLKVKRFNQL